MATCMAFKRLPFYSNFNLYCRIGIMTHFNKNTTILPHPCTTTLVVPYQLSYSNSFYLSVILKLLVSNGFMPPTTKKKIHCSYSNTKASKIRYS